MSYSYSRQPGLERKCTTSKNKRATCKNESSRSRIFQTECTEGVVKKPKAHAKATVEEDAVAAARDNQLMLWQFVNVLVNDSVSSSVTVTFKNCKRGSKCSKKEMKVARTKAFDSHSELMNRLTYLEESDKSMTKSQLKKKNKANNALPIQPNESDSGQSILFKVCVIITIFIIIIIIIIINIILSLISTWSLTLA